MYNDSKVVEYFLLQKNTIKYIFVIFILLKFSVKYNYISESSYKSAIQVSNTLAKQVLIENSLLEPAKDEVDYCNSICIDMRDTLGKLREKIAFGLGVEPNSFKIRRSKTVYIRYYFYFYF